jgi:hypothetical protein
MRFHFLITAALLQPLARITAGKAKSMMLSSVSQIKICDYNKMPVPKRKSRKGSQSDADISIL